MTKDEIKNKIIQQIVTVAPDVEKSEIPEDENLQQALEIDSYDFLNLLTALFEDLGVEVPEKDYGNVATLNAMTDYFAQRVK